MRTNLGDLMDRSKDPDLPAIVDAADWERAPERSHRWLDERCRAVARALIGRGLRRGDRVAVFAANSADWLAVYFGAMRAGLVAVPVNWRFPDETVAHVLKDSEAKLLFVDEARRGRAPVGLPAVGFGPDFEAFLDPGDFETVVPGRTRWRRSSTPPARPACPRACRSPIRAISGWSRCGSARRWRTTATAFS